ncbi:NADPH dehydrogenase NamA [Pontibacter sp. MBLB2868]|uniref:NADPH dehydrogenase NamA n=1 Tax=Pontibacter sp. MBLB2868 TaxID=3451555 RepID=UPI003F754C4D
MSKLFSPLLIRGIKLKNRIVVSPMCMYSSVDGFSTDWHLVHLGSRAVGGAALVLAEATAVVPEGRITPHDLGLWNNEHIEGLQRITSFISEQGSVPGIQLAHAGRKASHHRPWDGGGAIKPQDEHGWQTVAPSALPFQKGDPVPHELSIDEIQDVINAFVAAAKRSIKAGFKVIELHAAHGYLLHEFYSPLSNHRTDAYGGSFENRIRLLIEVTERVREVWPEEYPLFVRISATDWTEGGWTVDDSVALALELKKRGVDLIDCSTGGNVPAANIPVGPGYQVPFAQQVRQQANVLTGTVGLITEAWQAEEILVNGQADIVLLARELLRDPYFAMHAALELGDEHQWPPQYERARPRT